MAPKAPSPSLSPPAGVPPSGNGKFIALAVLLIGAIGVVIAWKACQKPPPPVVLAFDAGPPPGPSKNIDEDIPPPPVIEDSGAEDAGKKTTVVTQVSSGCEAKKCTGASNSDIELALAFRAKQAHRCYDNALGQDPTLRGKIAISVRIGNNGQTCSAGVASNEMSSAPSVADCVVRSFRGQTFPAPKGGCLDVNVPINFVPRQ